MSALYFCTKENNTCSKKEECKRYVESDNETTATLFKNACTDENNHVLFIKYEIKEEDNNGQNQTP